MYKKLRFLTTLLLLAVSVGAWADGKYVKITSLDDLTDGNYLIVYEANTQTYVFDGSLTSLDVSSNFVNTVYKSENNEITGTEFENAYVTITDIGNSFSIRTESGYYIGHSGSSNALKASTTQVYENTISFSSGSAVITCNNYKLKFNSTSGQMRFRYFGSGQQAISLYKYVDNSTPTCATPVFSPAAGTYTSAQDVTISTETDGATIYYTTDGNAPTTNSSVYSSAINVSSTTTIKAMAVKEGMNNSAVATATYTIEEPTPSTGGTWELTDLADLTSTDIFVIVGNNGDNYAMPNDNGTTSAPSAVEVTISNNKITSEVADNIKWNISGNATDGYTFYPNGTTTTWLYCTNTNNGVRVGTNDNKTFVIDQGYLKHVGTSRYVGVYNSQDWRCYTSTGGNIANQTFAFYKYVEGSDTPSTDPSIAVTPKNIQATAEETEGTINVTYNNITDVDAKVAFYAADGVTKVTYDWLEAEVNTDNNLYYVIGANSGEARTAYLKVWAYDNDHNEVYSDLITITQAAAPVIYTTIPDLFTAATSTSTPVNVTFGNWVVTGVNGSQLFVTDGTYGFIVYQSKHGFKEGDILSGTASCNLVLYNGSAELTGLTSTTSGLTVETGGSVTPVATTIDALGAVNTGSVVTLSNLTYDGTNLSDGTNTIIPWYTLYTGTFVNGKTYNVTGVFVLYNNDKRILPRSAADIEEVETPIAVTFSEEDTNDTNITANEGNEVVATLTRTLSSEYWSTFSVPFDVTEDQVTAVLGKGVKLRKFQGSEGTVIKFQEAKAIEAGHAYLVKPAATVTNPVFTGVTVENTVGETDNDSYGYGFVGAVIKKTLKTDQTELFLGTDAKFYYPEEGKATMKGLRGYFVVPGTEPSKLSVDVNGSGIATSINSMNIEGMGDGNIYNLNGQRVNAPQKGLYIVNGKKVIIK